jgi:hypothetical protein
VASVSELARRSGLTVRTVATEVRHLKKADLVQIESIGAADLVRGNLRHPAAPFIEGLLKTPAVPRSNEGVSRKLRESLVAWGAPLAGEKSVAHLTLNEALLDGLKASHHDGTLLRVLPVVLAKNLEKIDWSSLKEESRRRKLKAELGMIVELTADLVGRDDIKERVADLRDRRQRVRKFLPEIRSEFERRLAEQRTPPSAKRWGFLMNLTEDSFRSTLQKHRA